MNFLDCFAAVGYAKTLLAQAAQRQEAVIRVCCVYHCKVSASAMDKALKDLDMSPEWVYLKLCEGNRIPRLDEALGVAA